MCSLVGSHGPASRGAVYVGPALLRRCRTLPSIALDQLPSQAASLVARGKQGLLRPPSSSVLPRWWVGALALVWGSVTPMSTSGSGQTLAMGSPITGPACVMVWAVGGRLRGALDANDAIITQRPTEPDPPRAGPARITIRAKAGGPPRGAVTMVCHPPWVGPKPLS